jgi:hypothetical protein
MDVLSVLLDLLRLIPPIPDKYNKSSSEVEVLQASRDALCPCARARGAVKRACGS